MKIDIPSCEMAESGYAFIKELGSGLFGTCYLCINPFGKAVVLKRYEPASYRMNQEKIIMRQAFYLRFRIRLFLNFLGCLILVAVNI